MRDPDKEKGGPICDNIAVIVLEEKNEEDDCEPTILHEIQSPHSSSPTSIKPFMQFARPRGWYNQSEPTPSEFFYQILTSETGIRRIAYILSTWELDTNTKNMRAVSIILISQNFHPTAFKEIALEVSEHLRSEDISIVSELFHFLTDELVDEGSVIEIRTKTLNVELSFEMPPGVPVTSQDVCMLFRMLGFSNVIKLVHAILSDCRIVLTSSSLMRLSRCQNALLSLLYPFVYLHSCVTILPDSLFELLESPTPFLIGILSEFDVRNRDGYIFVNIDNGEVHIPDTTEIHEPDERGLRQLQRNVRNVLFKNTNHEDFAISNEKFTQVEDSLMDKQLRACFILYFAEMLYGYQYFILYTRIKGSFEQRNPTSLTFHSGAFRGFRRLNDYFSNAVFKSVFFQVFLATRALPRRIHDIFDKVSCMKELDQLVNRRKMSDEESCAIIENIAYELVQKERFMEKCSSRQKEYFGEIFLKPDTECRMRSNSIIHTIKPKMRSHLAQNVMLPSVNAHVEYHTAEFDKHSHRIEVLRNCMEAIFNEQSDYVSKSLRAVELSMRFAPLRIELCRILHQHSQDAILTAGQFEAISILMNSALHSENENDENGVVHNLMYLSNVFNKRLTPGMQQYMYTTVQNHKLWKSATFWSSSFYYEVHETLFSDILKKERKLTNSLWCHTGRPCAMELIDFGSSNQEQYVQLENEIIQAQAKHYANLMIGLQIPLTEDFFEDENSNTSFQQEKCKWILWTIDSIFSLTGRMNNLSRSQIQNFVEAHVETMRDVYLEVSASSSFKKKYSYYPYLISGNEYLICDPINCYLIPSKTEKSVSAEDLDTVLPADGSLFLTNYRIIFKGKSVEMRVTNGLVVQTMPLYSFETQKKVTNKKWVPKELKNVQIEHIISIRSHLSAPITVAFNELVDNIALEKFLEVIETSSRNCFAQNDAKTEAKSPNTVHKFGTLSALRKLEHFSKKKGTDPRRIRSLSAHRGAVQMNFDKHDELDHLKNNHHVRYGMIDYPRIGLIGGKMAKLRLSAANIDYSVCPTYPSAFFVPSETNESEIAKVAKGFVEQRIPIVVWMSKTGALLIRGSSFNSPDMVKKFKKVVKYRKNLPKLGSSLNGSQQTLTSKASSNDETASNIIPISDVKSSELQINYFMKLMHSSPMAVSQNGCSSLKPSCDDTLTIDNVKKVLKRRAMYIVIEKGNVLKIPQDLDVEPIELKCIKESELKKSLSKVKHIQFRDASDKKVSFFEAWNSCGWQSSISRMLELSNSLVALMDNYNSSVAICLENGRNMTAILSSLTQILSDPYYRTMEGFQILLEKEWLALGHCFHSGTMDGASASIVCFLDCIHQVVNQFPSAFEFTDFYLRFICYHTSSGFFRTFIDDCEERRLQSENVDYSIPDDFLPTSIWEYIKAKRQTAKMFINLQFDPFFEKILYPSFSSCQISMWSFFSEIHLKHGSLYDIDAAEHEKNMIVEQIATEKVLGTAQSLRKRVSSLRKSRRRINEKVKLEKQNECNADMVKQLQHKCIVDVIENSDKRVSSSTADSNIKDIRHELQIFAPGPKPVQCQVCSNVMTRWSRAVSCKKCNFFLHEGCIRQEMRVNNIVHYYDSKPEDIELPLAAIITHPKNEYKESPSNTLQRNSVSSSQIPKLPPLFTGCLSKRGAKLKLWMPRFFVIYPDCPKVYYYESLEQWKASAKPSGTIDLAEYESFNIKMNGRRADIDLQLRTRSYRLLSENINEALKWKECIEHVIRE